MQNGPWFEVVLGIIAFYALWVSIRVFRAPHYETRQKWLQLLLIWVIPVFGAIVAHVMLAIEGRPPRTPEKGYTVPGDNAS